MGCGLPSIASGIGIDPTLPRDGTDFITPQVVIRIGVWLRSAALVTSAFLAVSAVKSGGNNSPQESQSTPS
jgi:hypothetical protein